MNSLGFEAFKLYADSTLKKMTKDDLISYIHILHHNWGAADERFCKVVEINQKIGDKAIPKIPKGDYNSIPHYRCPTCNGSVKQFENSFVYPYCHYCGQKLDWSNHKVEVMD